MAEKRDILLVPCREAWEAHQNESGTVPFVGPVLDVDCAVCAAGCVVSERQTRPNSVYVCGHCADRISSTWQTMVLRSIALAFANFSPS